MSSSRRDTFDSDAFSRGLRAMSQAIQRSPILAPYRPLQLVASGGFVSVMCLHNRSSSQDLDYFLHPTAFGQDYERIRAELIQIIKDVANSLRYVQKWANDDVRMFLTLLNDPSDLFERSKQQNVVAYEDQNLKVFAVLWEWVLVRKLKRVQMTGQRPRNEDWNDCLTICRLLHRRNPGGFGVGMLRQFDHTDREPPVLNETLTSMHRLLLRFEPRAATAFNVPTTNSSEFELGPSGNSRQATAKEIEDSGQKMKEEKSVEDNEDEEDEEEEEDEKDDENEEDEEDEENDEDEENEDDNGNNKVVDNKSNEGATVDQRLGVALQTLMDKGYTREGGVQILRSKLQQTPASSTATVPSSGPSTSQLQNTLEALMGRGYTQVQAIEIIRNRARKATEARSQGGAGGKGKGRA